MIPMNFMKSKAGFTLVELIVVIAILGILAGIAVPAYSGYIKKANNAADISTLGAIKTACESACALEDNVEKIVVTTNATGAVTSVEVYYSTANNATAAHTLAYTSAWACGTNHGTGVTCSVYGDFSTYMNGSNVTLKATSSTATLSNGTWTIAAIPQQG